MKRWLLVIVSVALVAPLVAQQPSAAELFNRGLLLERAEGKVAEAIALYERVITDYPNDHDVVSQALYRLALGYEATNDPRAMTTFEKIVKDFGDSRYAADARQRLGQPQVLPFKSTDISAFLPFSPTTTFSPDGRLAAYMKPKDGGSDRVIYLRDLTNGKERLIADWKFPYGASMALSPDGRHAYVVRGRLPASDPSGFDYTLRIFDTSGAGHHAEVMLAPLAFGGATALGGASLAAQLVWSPDGAWLPYLAPTADPTVAEVKLWSAATGQSRSLGIELDTATQFRWSPDGKQLAMRVHKAAKKIDEIRLVTAADGATRSFATSGSPALGRWTTTGQLVLRRPIPDFDTATDMFLLSLDTGSESKICHETTGPNGDTCSVSRDGRFVLRRSGADKHYFIRAMPNGSELPLTKGSGEETGATWSTDGRLIAFYSNRDGHWAEYVVTLDHLPVVEPVRIASLDVLPSEFLSPITEFGERLVFRTRVFENNISRLEMDPRTGHPVAGATFERLTQDAQINEEPVVSPDGTRIAYHFMNGVNDRNGGIAVMEASGANERHFPNLPLRGALYWRSQDEVLFESGSNASPAVSVLNVRTGAAAVVRQVPIHGWVHVAGRDEILSAPDGPGDPKPPVFRVVSLATGADRIIKTGIKGGDVIDLWFVSPDGKQIAYKVDRGPQTEVRVINTDGSGDRVLLPLSKDQAAPAAWSGDSRFLLYDPTYDGEAARVLNVATGESWPLFDKMAWASEGSWASNGSFAVVTTSASHEAWQMLSGITYDAVAKLMKK